MPDTTWFRWLQTLYNAVSPGGLFIFTTHGYQSKKYFGFPALNERGYWFLPSSEQLDLDVHQYGQTIVSPSYVCDKIKLLPYNPIIKNTLKVLVGTSRSLGNKRNKIINHALLIQK